MFYQTLPTSVRSVCARHHVELLKVLGLSPAMRCVFVEHTSLQRLLSPGDHLPDEFAT